MKREVNVILLRLVYQHQEFLVVVMMDQIRKVLIKWKVIAKKNTTISVINLRMEKVALNLI